MLREDIKEGCCGGGARLSSTREAKEDMNSHSSRLSLCPSILHLITFITLKNAYHLYKERLVLTALRLNL